MNEGDVGTQLSNVYRASGPLPELDFDLALTEAESIYSLIYPGEQFLPRAPDPEEIIIGEENEVKVSLYISLRIIYSSII